ncbi:MAG: class I SAM-dependent methyltransferase [Anaerolineales bacterium]|nr:class I SAM-dependent methyltransferase [Anaerolineales bacterium]MCS7248801.1 class I SAM-dependent methyltransferase [Anaerolineales bacterium]MDW8162614.1 class I SAM-dependent methyltransferase [Anaerolineales bacterium]MDW8446219.1 class I SAM-dependent methyltransferase [Anaerolineales bacterium]
MNFDEKAREWDNNPARRERACAVAEAMRRQVPLRPTMTALEYGCGTGLLSFELRHELGRIVLADNSTGMLEVLQEKITAAQAKNLFPIRLDLLVDPLPAQRFDLIYSLMTLHHILDTQRILSLFHRLLLPGGYLCIADLDKEDGSFHQEPFEGHLGFERQELAELATAVGFEVLGFETVYRMVKLVDGCQRHYPIFLMTARKREIFA